MDIMWIDMHQGTLKRKSLHDVHFVAPLTWHLFIAAWYTESSHFTPFYCVTFLLSRCPSSYGVQASTMVTSKLRAAVFGQVLQKELAYAEAQSARFANGTAMQPERNTAQRRYAQLMESIGALLHHPHCPFAASALFACHQDVNILCSSLVAFQARHSIPGY